MNDLSTCEFSVRFEIEGHKVSMSSAISHQPNDGQADKGFVFGNLLVEVATTLKDHLTPDEWESFLLSAGQLGDADH